MIKVICHKSCKSREVFNSEKYTVQKIGDVIELKLNGENKLIEISKDRCFINISILDFV